MRNVQNGKIMELLRRKAPVHFVGICGVGMAGLAYRLKARGHRVSGCDLSGGRMKDWLEGAGIPVREGHDPKHITKQAAWVVRTAAVGADAPEIRRAKQLGKPVFCRGEVLPATLAGDVSVAVGGTHGKTTTSTFIAHLLKHAGRRPAWCIGGDSAFLGGVAGAGRGGITVVEADESDGTIARYEPDIAVVTNIEFDHMEHFASVDAFEDCFRSLVERTRRKVVFCADDPRAARICRGAKGISYGFSKRAEYGCRSAKEGESSISFVLTRGGRALGRLDLPVPGRHNILNAMAASAVALELGLSFGEIRKGFARVGLPRRRFEKIVERNGVTVLSDYAHHPTEIAALIRTARGLKHRRLIAVYQPHRYTRTLALRADFPAAFSGLDKLVLVPVYAASEQPLKGGSTFDLYSECRKQAPRAEISLASSIEKAWEYLRQTIRRGDVLLVIGAGNVEKIAGWAKNEAAGIGRAAGAEVRKLAGRIRDGKVLLDAPMAARTTLKVGGTADILVEAGSFECVRDAMRLARAESLPFRAIGAGSNIVVSDLGLRGVTVLLRDGLFDRVRFEDGQLVAGAGVRLGQLVQAAAVRGLAGLEFLWGIPGTVGGALRTNAGAFGGEIGDRVAWVRCLDATGRIMTLGRREAGFGYRRAAGLATKIVLEAGFKLDKGAEETIKKRCKENAQRRRWMAGVRSAGSIFKNPPGDHAGRLVEAAGLKGTRVGGARVFEKHANVIVTEQGAGASDVIALMELARAEVLDRFGIELEPEVVILE